MSNVTSTFRSSASEATTPTIINLTVPLANAEASVAIGPGAKKILIRCRGFATIQFAFVSGNTNSEFISIPPGVSYYIDGVNFAGTIYLELSKPNQIVEIMEWN